MDITAIEGEELTAVEFVQDYLQMRFDGPMLVFYEWPSVLLSDFQFRLASPSFGMRCARRLVRR